MTRGTARAVGPGAGDKDVSSTEQVAAGRQGGKQGLELRSADPEDLFATRHGCGRLCTPFVQKSNPIRSELPRGPGFLRAGGVRPDFAGKGPDMRAALHRGYDVDRGGSGGQG